VDSELEIVWKEAASS